MIYDSITVSGSVKLKQYGSGSLTLDESGDIVMDRKIYMTGISASHIHDALGYEPYDATNPSGYMSEMTHNAITASLGFTPSTNARTITINEVSYDLSADRSWTILGGVTAFNTRSGSITLTAADVTGSLGFTPYNATNPSSFATQTYVNSAVSNLVNSSPATLDTLSELATALGNDAAFSTTISTALGNRLRIDTASQGLSATLQGYGRTNLGLGTAATSATGDFATAAHTHTSLQVTTALGYTPYNATNPSGFTTNTGTVTSVATSGTVSGLTLTGGTITTSGTITLGGTLSLTAANVNAVGAITNSTSGNAATATALSSGQSNWSGTGVLGNVVGLLAWKNYSNNHVIFDASASTNPSGGGCSNTNSTAAWTATYPTLMGWNGSTTYGVRVDSARVADSAGTATDSTKLPLAGGTMTGTITITNTDIRSNSTSNWTGAPGAQGKIQYHASRWYIVADQASDRIVQFRRNDTDTSYIDNSGNFIGNAATTSQRNFDGSLTSPDFYASGWFRNSGATAGLYNSTHNTHFYASGTGQWNFATSNNSWIQIALRPASHDSTVRGYLYADTSNNVGLLTYDGGWALRVDTSKNVQIYGSVSATNLSGTNTGDQTNISGNAANVTTQVNGINVALYNRGQHYGTPGQHPDYDTGVLGRNILNMNQTFEIGRAGFLDVWGATDATGMPPSCSHVQGIQSMHYTFGYGFQMAGQYDQDSMYIRQMAGRSYRGWRKIIDSGNIASQSVSYASTAGSAPANGGNAATVSDGVYLSGTQTITGIKYFQTNNGTSAVNNSNSAALEAYSTGNNSAFMSFHRGGHYAINMGLDSDNVFRIGGWSAGANRLQLNCDSGFLAVAGNIRSGADVYIDGNYGYGLVGLYSSTIIQGIFAMGDAYKLSAGGGAGNLYGLGWSHPNAGGQAANLSNHGLLVMSNGITQCALTNNIWASGDITAYSDARVKTNVEVIENAIEKIKAIRGVTFNRTDMEHDTKRHAGVIAQEILAVLPEVVTTNQDGMHSVAYGNLAGLFIEAIKEQQSQIEELKTIINGLTR